MATQGSGKVPFTERNSNIEPGAYSGTKVDRLTGPAVGKTGKKNSGAPFGK